MVQKCPLFCVGFVLSLYKKRAAVGGHDKARVKKTLGKLSKLIFRQTPEMKEKRIKNDFAESGNKKRTHHGKPHSLYIHDLGFMT